MNTTYIVQRIAVLDVARFIASFSVLFFHYFYNGITNGKVTSVNYIEPISSISKYAHIGVPFFFMISGYVIFFSALHKSAYQFMLSRMKRIYPAYWIAIIFTSTVSYFIGTGNMSVTGKQIIANFTMIQNYLGVESVDGAYWTLFYELRLYLLVSFILLFFNEKFLFNFFRLWPFLIIISIVLGHFKFLFGSNYSYFSFGVLIAMYERDRSTTTVVPLLVAILLTFYSININSKTTNEVIIYSFANLLFILFFFSLLFEKIKNIKLSNSYILGTLTYPLYLIHAHFGYMMLNYFATDTNKVYVYTIIFITVLILAYLIHLLVEVKLKNLWHKLFSIALKPILYLEGIVKKNTLIIKRN